MGGTGLCSNGTQNGCGVVYEMSQSSDGNWNETVLYSFIGGSDAAYPQGNLVLDRAGNLYGVTSAGGPSGQGTVFQVSPPPQPGGNWTEAVLYAFLGSPDGATPQASLVMDRLGNLYGTTSAGGLANQGSAFELSPPAIQGGVWTESILCDFARESNVGGVPESPLIFDSEGDLYGTTVAGGTNGGGTVFELGPPFSQGGVWTPTVAYAFTFDGLGGFSPYGGVVFGPEGALFGTTQSGGATGFGTVFRLGPPSQQGGAWSETVLHNFGGGENDGNNPVSDVAFVGQQTLYGTTAHGGPNEGGTVFRLSYSDGVLAYSFYPFSGINGYEPVASVIVHNAALYGTTVDGGKNGMGTVFKLGTR
jgi:uncharacterized repeat protein (TIGR03803 family)